MINEGCEVTRGNRSVVDKDILLLAQHVLT